MNNMIQVLFVGGVGLTVSAIVTWLAYISVVVFDNHADIVEVKGQDSHLEYRVDEVESDVDKLLEDFRQRDNGKAL